MKISTKQEASFADSFIEVPTTELDALQNIVDWAQIFKVLNSRP